MDGVFGVKGYEELVHIVRLPWELGGGSGGTGLWYCLVSGEGWSCRGWSLESVIPWIDVVAFIAMHVHHIFSMPPHVYDYLSTSYKHTTSEK
jgi:hypothetical protein